MLRVTAAPRLTAALLVAAAALPAGVAAQASPGIPTPESVLGFWPGDDFRLASYGESLEYFRRLDAASDHLTLVEVGQTAEGRPWAFALVSSPENLARVERHREIAWRLAHPEGLEEAEARELAREGKALVHIDGGLHATEAAGAQHTIRLAHELLARRDEPDVRRILDEVVLMLWPTANPDGQDMVVEWYRENLGTPYEVAPLPWLYQKYVGHDNNRDAYMLNTVESRVHARVWRHWEPQIIYVHHQSSPFPTRIWLPPFAEPIAPRASPLMSRVVNTIGMAIAQALEERGQPGATHMGRAFDAWYPGYIDYLPMLQNQAAFWTETALYRYATPRFYTLDDFPEARRDFRAEALYVSPWRGGWWRLGDAVDYMLTASWAVLDYAARYREELLMSRWRSGRAIIDRYRQEPPFAYFVPPDQRDPVASVELLRRLAFNGVRVHQLRQAVGFRGVEHAPGTWVVRTDQEFGDLVRQLLERQDYPDLREFPDGPPEQPYDAAGWTLSHLMGVRVLPVDAPLTPEVEAALEPVVGRALDWREAEEEPADPEKASGAPGAAARLAASFDAAPFDSPFGVGFDTDSVAAGIVPPPGRMTGSGARLALDPAQNNAFRALNDAWRRGATVRFEPGRPGTDGTAARSGRYLVSVGGDVERGWVRDLALRAERTGAAGTVLPRPRVGLYRPWRASMDEGWTRWLLERYGFEFTNAWNDDLRAGRLRDRFDVLILPAESPDALRDGWEEGRVPPRYAGGLGPEGLRALDAFVREGGTLVCLNQSSELAIEALGLPVRNAVAGVARSEFFTGASILEVLVDPAHPVMAGMPERAAVFVDRSPAFETQEGFSGAVLARYPERGSPLLSGYLLGEEHLHGRAAALEVRHGLGRVLLLGFRPQWRGQTFGTFRVLFNAALFHGEVAAAGAAGPGSGG